MNKNYFKKQDIRDKVWKTLEDKNLITHPRPCFGRIPNFIGSEIACEKIKEIEEFKKAKCVFCAPDSVLTRIREIVLEEGKTLVVALPHMKDFLKIDEVKNIKKQ
jgi:5-formyltetrahydrofolate cyclo-ligase